MFLFVFVGINYNFIFSQMVWEIMCDEEEAMFICGRPIQSLFIFFYLNCTTTALSRCACDFLISRHYIKLKRNGSRLRFHWLLSKSFS